MTEPSRGHQRIVRPQLALVCREDDRQRVHAAGHWNHGVVNQAQDDQTGTAEMMQPVENFMGRFGEFDGLMDHHWFLSVRINRNHERALLILLEKKAYKVARNCFLSKRRLIMTSGFKTETDVSDRLYGGRCPKTGRAFAVLVPSIPCSGAECD